MKTKPSALTRRTVSCLPSAAVFAGMALARCRARPAWEGGISQGPQATQPARARSTSAVDALPDCCRSMGPDLSTVLLPFQLACCKRAPRLILRGLRSSRHSHHKEGRACSKERTRRGNHHHRCPHDRPGVSIPWNEDFDVAAALHRHIGGPCIIKRSSSAAGEAEAERHCRFSAPCRLVSPPGRTPRLPVWHERTPNRPPVCVHHTASSHHTKAGLTPRRHDRRNPEKTLSPRRRSAGSAGRPRITCRAGQSAAAPRPGQPAC